MKCFKEIENSRLNKPYYIDFRDYGHVLRSRIPEEYFIKYKSIFNRINDLSDHILLVSIRENYRELALLDVNDKDKEEKLKRNISSGIDKLLYTYGDWDFVTKGTLIMFFDKYEDYSGKITISDDDYRSLRCSFLYFSELLRLVKLTDDNLLEDIENALDELEKFKVDISIPKYHTYPIEDAWYILPGNKGIADVLYNTTGVNGHKETTLENLFKKLLYGRLVFSYEYANNYYDKARELENKDFILLHIARDYHIEPYNDRADILDSTGVRYGAHELFSNFKKVNMRELLGMYIEPLVPEEKLDEYYDMVNEKEEYFDILDSHNLPAGFYDIIMWVLENANNESLGIRTKEEHQELFAFTNNQELIEMSPETYAACKVYSCLSNLEWDLEQESKNKISNYDLMPTYIFNQTTKDLVKGIYMAYALVIDFFTYLYNHTDNYNECIDYLKKITTDELLVRCCGFAKVVRQKKGNEMYSEILTSDLNYEENFKEYTDHGWKVQFVPPIRLDEYNGKLREMSDYCIVKRFHSKD